MSKTPPIVLTIAGFDPSSGAGITADIKTIAAHKCYGVACITALTAQSTLGVRRIQPIDSRLLAETLAELALDMKFSAVHVGMLGSAAAASIVADFLSSNHPEIVVLDPVLKSTSGTDLLDGAGLSILIERLMPLATVITPNLDEASVISGLAVHNQDEMRAAAAKMHQMGARAVVIKGGHLEELADLLSIPRKNGLDQQFFTTTRIESNSTHGTGCAFSTALACHLACGRSLEDAVRLSQAYVRSAIRKAYAVGSGVGPINHLYAWAPGEEDDPSPAKGTTQRI